MSHSPNGLTDVFTVSAAPGVTFWIAVPDTDDPNVQMIRNGKYPPSLQGLFTALTTTLSAPARVLDLGGYLGGFGLAAAAAGYEVAIVEANPRNAEWIRRSLALNRFAYPVQVIETAVGEVERWVEFHAEGPYGHVQQEHSEANIRVKQITLPALMQTIGWEAPSFVKMDVEGSEGGVLRGARSWFALGHRPTFLYEANGHTLHWFGDSQVKLRTMLASLGYHQYEVEPDGSIRVPTRLEPRVVVDYLASAQPLSALPHRSAWKVLRRTAAALRRRSRPSRMHVLRMVVGVMKGHFGPR